MALMSVFASVLLVSSTLAQRPGPGGNAAACTTGDEGDIITAGCPAGGVIKSVSFAEYGAITGACPALSDGSCGTSVQSQMATVCGGQPSCTMKCGHNDPSCCTNGVGSCCGCAFTTPSGQKIPFLPLKDPCPGAKKQQGLQVVCNNTHPASNSSTFLTKLKVNSLESPITIDDPKPYFSWVVTNPTRGSTVTGYEIEVREQGGSVVWSTGMVASNRTSYIQWGGSNLTSDTVYMWGVRSYPGPSTWSNSTFQTALMEQTDWSQSQWIQAPGGDSPGQFASQMRKVFSLPAGDVSRATAFVALPGYGQVFVNGHQVDNKDTGTRSLSQYDVRMLYHTYDISKFLVPGGVNVIAAYVGLGWFGHPAVPPQAKRFPFGPPTLRLVLRVHQNGSSPFLIGTDGTWQQTQGPVIYADEYNGQTYDARLETPGWTSDTSMYPTVNGSSTGWTPVQLSSTDPKFALGKTIFSSAAFQPIKVITRRTAEWMREPSPGVYVYDFSQNEPGWCRLSIVGPAGLAVQLRHAEVLQHPPYGPRDGNIYNGNLRSAKATDIYVLKGDPNGEEIEFSFTQHGFRYVELTFLDAEHSAPTLETLQAVNIRSSTDLSGDLTFGDDMLQKVHHNIVWGQASNLMMVPSDCDNRDERFGWTGDSALTADEAANNFDLSSFYTNWARMLDDSSQNGAVACWVPGGVGHSSPSAGGSCDASWGSAFPSVVYALFKWSGDILTPAARWTGLTRFIDNEYSRVTTSIKSIFTGPGDWCPVPVHSPDSADFVGETRVNTEFSSGFSFINDVGHILEMATALGYTEDIKKYSAMLNDIRSRYHAAWYNTSTNQYVNGEQTAQVLALELDVMPSAEIKSNVVNSLVKNIIAHKNHTTTGIIGWRYQPGVLSKIGYGDLAYQLMTQRTYPSIGYEILNSDEPATTLWELWDSDAEGPNMNSRNHIMFGGNGVWLHTYVGGIDNYKGSIGFEHVQMAPPVDLVAQAAKYVCCSACSSCNSNINGSTSSSPLTWSSAEKTTVNGDFSLSWKVACIASNPCGGTGAMLTATVSTAANTVATTIIPVTQDASNVVITEGSATVWKAGAYVSGVPGVTGAALVGSTVEIHHGSGQYEFVANL